ncbi:MAG: hypothetical protein HQM00_02330 [Magnetococcales bacterium]|nr:hypothetical protein [Magnetococcales bacterium]
MGYLLQNKVKYNEAPRYTNGLTYIRLSDKLPTKISDTLASEEPIATVKQSTSFDAAAQQKMWQDALDKNNQASRESQSAFAAAMKKQTEEADKRSADLFKGFESTLSSTMDKRMQDMSNLLSETQVAQAMRLKEQEDRQREQDQSAWDSAVQSNDAMADMTRQNFDINQGVTLKSDAIGAGAFGSSRSAIASGIARGGMEQDIANQSMQNLSGFAGKEIDRSNQTWQTHNQIGNSIMQQAMDASSAAGLEQLKSGLTGVQSLVDASHEIGKTILGNQNKMTLLDAAGTQQNNQLLLDTDQRNQLETLASQTKRDISALNTNQVGSNLIGLIKP